MTLEEADWEARRKRIVDNLGLMTIPLGGLSKQTPYERERGIRVGRRRVSNSAK